MKLCFLHQLIAKKFTVTVIWIYLDNCWILKCLMLAISLTLSEHTYIFEQFILNHISFKKIRRHSVPSGELNTAQCAWYFKLVLTLPWETSMSMYDNFRNQYPRRRITLEITFGLFLKIPYWLRSVNNILFSKPFYPLESELSGSAG